MKYENGRMIWSSWEEHEKLLEQVVKYLGMMKDEIVRETNEPTKLYHGGMLATAYAAAVTARDHARRVIAAQTGRTPQGQLRPQPAPAQPQPPPEEPQIDCAACKVPHSEEELCPECRACVDCGCCSCEWCANCQTHIKEGELCDQCSEGHDEGAICKSCCCGDT